MFWFYLFSLGLLNCTARINFTKASGIKIPASMRAYSAVDICIQGVPIEPSRRRCIESEGDPLNALTCHTKIVQLDVFREEYIHFVVATCGVVVRVAVLVDSTSRAG
ncbi:hypothetical protein EV421DRAFT_544389 [Armillaria borealis]|uniref:Secreted protein n=1 Tax=Armillaria borealis TaxID=47425 RepID=A0AA39JIC6_9AGAR|nr:hypothetical protein EV421DRAFT_544389 [Armillaria borealis]